MTSCGLFLVALPLADAFHEPVFVDMNLNAELSEGKVRLWWDPYPLDGFQYYQVVRSDTNSDPVYPEDGSIALLNDSSFTFYSDVKPEGTQYYRICAVAGETRYCSKEVFIFTGLSDDASPGETCEDEECGITAVISLDLEEVHGTIVLAWTVAGEFPYGYKIMKSIEQRDPTYPPQGDDSYVYLSDGQARTYIDQDVDAGGKYFYRVCKSLADGSCGEYSNSAEISVSLPPDNEDDGVSITLTAEEDEEGNVLLYWNAVGDFTKGYHLVRSTEFPDPVYPPIEGDTTEFISEDFRRSFEDVNVENRITYYYRICRYLGNDECGEYSNTAEITVGESTAIIEEPFPDIAGHVFAEAILYVKNEGIVEGYPDGFFRPDGMINRAEFVKILMEARYPEDSMGSACFPDIGSEWFALYVCGAKTLGIIEGRGDGNFAPDSNVNFAEAAKILVLVFYRFEPADRGSEWYEKYIHVLQLSNAIPQTIMSIDQPVTRAEMAEMIMRLREGIEDSPSNILLGS